MGFLESDTPLDDQRDMLRKNLKITYSLEGLSLKLWLEVSDKSLRLGNLTQQSFTVVLHEIFVVQ